MSSMSYVRRPIELLKKLSIDACIDAWTGPLLLVINMRERGREIAIRLWWFAINPYIDVVFITQKDFENIEPVETQLNSNLKTVLKKKKIVVNQDTT